TLATSAAAVQGKIGLRRSTPECESQLLAELTSLPGTFAPCSRAKIPTNRPAGDFHGGSIPPEGNSLAAVRYRNDGRTDSSATSLTPTTCGIGNARVGAGAAGG